MLSLSSHVLLAIPLCVVVVNGAPAQRSELNLRSYHLPLQRNPYFGFLANISIGTPAQQVTAFTDWTWISQYLVTTECDGSPTDTARCLSPQQLVFNQSLSSSYRNETSLYPSRSWNPNEFFGTIDFSVDYASEIETVGPSSSRIVVQASNFQPGIFTSSVFPFFGIFGLAPVFRSDNASTQSPFYQMWRTGAWFRPFTAFIYCYKESKALCNGYDGIQTLGDYDTSITQEGLTWYSIVGVPEVNVLDFPFAPSFFNYWALRVTHVSIGNEPQALNTSTHAAGIFDHASRGRGAPLSAISYQRLIALSNATAMIPVAPPNNGAQAFYQVDCSKTMTLPLLKYCFGGSNKVWQITPASYVEVLSPGICVFNIRTIGDGDFVIGNFGETFLKDKYVVFDHEKLRIGLGNIGQ